jgi:hypothetical protein
MSVSHTVLVCWKWSWMSNRSTLNFTDNICASHCSFWIHFCKQSSKLKPRSCSEVKDTSNFCWDNKTAKISLEVQCHKGTQTSNLCHICRARGAWYSLSCIRCFLPKTRLFQLGFSRRDYWMLLPVLRKVNKVSNADRNWLAQGTVVCPTELECELLKEGAGWGEGVSGNCYIDYRNECCHVFILTSPNSVQCSVTVTITAWWAARCDVLDRCQVQISIWDRLSRGFSRLYAVPVCKC